MCRKHSWPGVSTPQINVPERNDDKDRTRRREAGRRSQSPGERVPGVGEHARLDSRIPWWSLKKPTLSLAGRIISGAPGVGPAHTFLKRPSADSSVWPWLRDTGVTGCLWRTRAQHRALCSPRRHLSRVQRSREMTIVNISYHHPALLNLNIRPYFTCA